MSIDRFTPHNLAEILRDQFHAEASGTLVLEADTGEEIRIYFSRGLIDLALQAGPHLEFLSDLMSSSTSVSKLPEHLRERPPRPVELAELLGDDVGRPEVQKAVRRETDVAVQEAFRLTGGAWSLAGGDEPGVFEPDVPGTLEVVMKGISAISRWAQIGRLLSAQQRTLRPSSVPLFPVERLPLAPEEAPPPVADPTQSAVLDALRPSDPIGVEEVLTATDLSAPQALAALLALELSGRVKVLPGRRYVKVT